MMKPRIWKTLVAVIAAVLICDGVAAQHTVDDLTSFIVVLRPLPRGEAAFDPKTFGGTLEHRSAFRMVVRMPEEAVANMRSHPGVRSVQRVGTGMPRREQSSMAVPKIGIHGDGLWSTGAYAYDGKGSIVSIGPNSDAKTDVYGYDSLDRLKTASVHAGTTPHSQSYEYDQYGNLTARTTDGVRITTPANPSTNRLAASLGAQYDASGNMTHDPAGRDLQYDAAGMVTASEGRFVYLYTADDERVVIINRHLNPVQWRWTLRDLSQKVVREYTSAATGTPQQTFLWLEDRYYAGSRLIAADMEPSEGGRRHFHLDHLGSTRLITNGSGERISSHTYYPFGAEATSIHQAHARGYSREEPIRFTGHERDDLGSSLTEDPRYLDYMHARFYGPVWGRFLSVDPGKDWDARQAQSWNMYAYVRNNPVRYVDPTGRVADDTADGEPRKKEPKVDPGPKPPVPVPGIPGSDWKWNPDPGNSRGGSWGPTKPRKGKGGGQPSASPDTDGPVPHWDVDDGLGNRRRYDDKGNFLTPEEAHGNSTKGPQRLTNGEVLGLIGLGIVGTAIFIITGGSAALQPATGVIVVPTNSTQFDPDQECPHCA